MAAANNQVITGPWIEGLVRQYLAGARIARPPTRVGLALTIVAAIGLLLAPLLLHLDRAAYPSDPERQQALEACRRSDPTFVRFSAGDREACYDRFRHLAQRAAVAQPQ